MTEPPTNPVREAWRPLPHVPPDTVLGALRFRLRLFLDFEVCTVYRDLKKALPERSGKVLEVGCGLQPYRHLLPPLAEYQALDWAEAESCFGCRSRDVVYYDGTRFPFPDGMFAFLFHTEVLEHVYLLAPFLSECSRVLAAGGEMLFTIPFSARNHYTPYDYWRLTPESLRRLLQEARFSDIVVVPRGSDITVAIHKVNSVCYRLLLRPIRQKGLRLVNRLFFALLFALPVFFLTVMGHLALLLKFGSPDDPLGYTVCCRKRPVSAR